MKKKQANEFPDTSALDSKHYAFNPSLKPNWDEFLYEYMLWTSTCILKYVAHISVSGDL